MEYISVKDFLEIASNSVQLIITESNSIGVSIKGYPPGLKTFLKKEILEKKVIRMDMISEGCVNLFFE